MGNAVTHPQRADGDRAPDGKRFWRGVKMGRGLGLVGRKTKRLASESSRSTELASAATPSAASPLTVRSAPTTPAARSPRTRFGKLRPRSLASAPVGGAATSPKSPAKTKALKADAKVKRVRIGKPKKKKYKPAQTMDEVAAAAAAVKTEARLCVLRRIRQGDLCELHRTFSARAQQLRTEQSQCADEMASGDMSTVPEAPGKLVASFRSAFTEMNVQWASDEAVASLFSDRVIFRGAFSDAEVRGKAAVLDALNNGMRTSIAKASGGGVVKKAGLIRMMKRAEIRVSDPTASERKSWVIDIAVKVMMGTVKFRDEFWVNADGKICRYMRARV